jgi:hypothetical protein
MTAITVVSIGFAVPIQQSDAMMMREIACEGCDPDSKLGSGVSSSHYGANGHTTVYTDVYRGGCDFTP